MKKKKYNKNIIVFAVCFAILISGLASKVILSSVLSNVLGVIKGDVTVESATANIDNATTEYLPYHNLLLDINSIKDNILGTRVIIKDDTTIAKTPTNSLIYTGGELMSDEEINEVVSNVTEIKDIAEGNGAKFLYCAVPGEEYYYTSPGNAIDLTKNNYDNFIKQMSLNKIPVLDFSSVISDNYDLSDVYYYTDHHWKATVGFDAAGHICQQLNSLYGFEYNREYTHISNYNITTYSNWFLGSQGKKTGTFFTWQGADDFDLITPKFETDMIVSEPLKEEIRTGNFEDTVIYKENLKKDYYNVSTYSTYGGGDKRLQIITNKMNPDGKTILVIRDSVACVVTPFLSLQTSELHVCDIRDFENNTSEKINVEDYIKEINPDYVIVLFSNTTFPGI